MDFETLVKTRRSIKQYEDTTVNDQDVQDAIELATYAPNHGMREPWRIVWVKKHRVADFSQLFGSLSFKWQTEKQAQFNDKLAPLAGVLLVVGPRDRRQKEHLEDILAVGGFMQTLSLALHQKSIGSCIKTPGTMFIPELNDALNIQKDEMLYGLIYLTAQTSNEIKERKNSNLISEF